MLKMLASTSRVVLILITLAVIAGFLMEILEPKEFMILAGMVFAFYFTKAKNNGNGDIDD